MVYVGIESGNDIVLKKVTKGATYKTILQACQRIKRHGYILSCMVILGLGGKTYTKEHIADTASVLSETSPDFVGALTLQLEEGVYEEFMNKFGEPFVPLDDLDILDELRKTCLRFQVHSASDFSCKSCFKRLFYRWHNTGRQGKNACLD